MKKPVQRVMHCPCGNPKVLAKGLCPTCYTLKRQDEEYFGGHREEVLKRQLPLPRAWMHDAKAWKAISGGASS